MKYRLLCTAAILLAALHATAQPTSKGSDGNHIKRIYTIGVNEVNEDLGGFYDLNRAIEEEARTLNNGDRGIGSLIFSTYRAFAADKAATAVNSTIDMGISLVYNTLRSHRGDWMKAIENESRFSIALDMDEEVSDFYMLPSEEGALSVQDIAFRGFSCRQYLSSKDNSKGPEVFNVELQLDTTKTGILRMIQHSKFQMKVKKIRFNPYLCEIPNDSTYEEDLKIPFDFKKRKDLVVRLHTVLKSSWVNEAIIFSKDQVLGEFDLEIRIDPEMMQDSCFTYDCDDIKDTCKLKNITLTGESFIVPRSYIGKIDGKRTWGTGQYRLEMTLSESCRINEDAYKVMGRNGKMKWDRDAWHSEWKIIRKRRKLAGEKEIWHKGVEKMTMKWKDGQWITEIVSPCTNILIQQGKSFITEGSTSQAQPAGNGKP